MRTSVPPRTEESTNIQELTKAVKCLGVPYVIHVNTFLSEFRTKFAFHFTTKKDSECLVALGILEAAKTKLWNDAQTFYQMTQKATSIEWGPE